MAIDEWKEITDGFFGTFRFHVAVPRRGQEHGASSFKSANSRRLQVIKRPGVDNAQINDWGKEPTEHSSEIVFFGPDYLDRFKQFEAILNRGLSETLTLPHLDRSVVAKFSNMDFTSSIADGDGISCSVSWLTEETSEVIGVIPTDLNDDIQELDDSKTLLDKSISAAETSVSENKLLTTVRNLEGGISTARSALNTVTSLDKAVRARIEQVRANIDDTLRLARLASDRIQALFGDSDEAAIPPGAPDVDETTGLRVGDVTDSDEIEEVDNDATAPVTQPDTGLELKNFKTRNSAAVLVANINEGLKEQREALQADTNSGTEDIENALILVSANLVRFKDSFTQRNLRQVVTPSDLSIMEVAFCNNIDVGDIETILRNNTFIEDPLDIPKGTVVNL